MTDKLKRRLTTVLCADVHGYSRLMEADEAGTLAELRRHRTAMTRLVERHDGRIVNTWGDAVIAEFASVVEAVQCAIEIQQEISSQEMTRPGTPDAVSHRHQSGRRDGRRRRHLWRRGQHRGAAAGTCRARRHRDFRPVYDQVRNKLSVGFDCLGQQQMKNVAPVISYRVAMIDGDSARGSLPVGESRARPGAASPAEPAAPGLRGEHQRPGGCVSSGRASRTCLAPLPQPSPSRDFWF